MTSWSYTLPATRRRARRAIQTLAVSVLSLGVVNCSPDGTATEPEFAIQETVSEDARSQLEATVAAGLISPQTAERIRHALADLAAELRAAVLAGELSAEDARARYEGGLRRMLARALGGRTST
jgi:hypothetical protein